MESIKFTFGLPTTLLTPLMAPSPPPLLPLPKDEFIIAKP